MSLPNMRRVLVEEYSLFPVRLQPRSTYVRALHSHAGVLRFLSVSLLVKHRMLLRLEKRSTEFQSRVPLQKIDDEGSRSRAEVGRTDVIPGTWPFPGAFLPIKCTAQAQEYQVQNSKISLTRFA